MANQLIITALALLIVTVGGFSQSSAAETSRSQAGGLDAVVPYLSAESAGTFLESNPFAAEGPDMPIPARRAAPGAAYDVESDRVILFGGDAGPGPKLGDTWAYDYTNDTWTDKSPPLAPPARAGHPMAYDSESDLVVLFGGWAGGGPTDGFDDTWTYDFNTNTWTEMNPASSPSVRWGGQMEYDTESDILILLGGHIGTGATATEFNETWAYDVDADTWTQMEPVPRSPIANWHGMVYDAESDRLIRFGGDGDGGITTAATWSYDYNGNAWTQMFPTTRPTARWMHAMAYDRESDRTVLFGGDVGNFQTWAYDLNTDSWSERSLINHPSGRLGHAMAYDAESDRIILFGGEWPFGGTKSNQTWAYDYNTDVWTPRATEVESILRPSSRSDYGMAYDAESDRVVLFGGFGGSELGDTWAYDVDTNEWASMEPATSPSPRFLFATAYDAESDRVILFGGADDPTLTPLDETWAYDLNSNSWANMDPATRPPGRWGRMAYDAESDRVVLFGGASGHVTSSAAVFNDTWAYDYNSNLWQEMSPRPTRSTSHAMSYDAESDGIVVFGGESGPLASVAGTWVYDFNNDSWIDAAPSGAPPLGIHYASAYDLESDRIVVWGGVTFGGFIGQVWTYDINGNMWGTPGATQGPSARNLHRTVYDTDSDRIVTFGGRWPPTLTTEFNDETWGYDLNGNTWTPLIVPPSEPQELEALAGEVFVGLTWTGPAFQGSHPISGYQIYREPAESLLIASVGTVLSYTDTNVSVGTTYRYHVRAMTAAGQSGPSNEIPATPFDATDPSIAISSPTDDETLTAVTVEVTGTASDNVAVEVVELSLDGTSWGSASGTTTWSGTLTLQEGLNTVRARATDTSGNLDSTSISVTVELTPLDGDGPDGVVEVPPWLIGVILAAVAGIAGVTFFLLWRRRS